MEHLIGVDLGTSLIKATLFDAQGVALADAKRKATLRQTIPGLAEQDGDEFYRATLETISEVVEKVGVAPATVAGIAFAGQMAGAMGIDREWNAVTPWYPSSLDVRYRPYLQQLIARAGTRLLELNGALPFGAPRLMWWQNELPDVYRRIHKVMILANFVAGRMAGLKSEEAFIDPSYLSWFGLADTARRCWCPELIELTGVEPEKLPRIVPATQIIGYLTPRVARECRLISGIPLIAGAGDQVASCLGAGLVYPGQIIDVAGTFSVLATCLDRYLADVRNGMLQCLAGPISESHWYVMTYIGGGGLSHRWACNQLYGAEEVSTGVEDDSMYVSLDEQATLLPAGSEGLLFIPHLAGRCCPEDPGVRGAWVGFTWTHTRAHLYRAVLESIAYDYAEALDVIRQYLPDVVFHEVRVIGGGAKSMLWNQIKADVLALPYVRLEREDVAVLGCAVMAGCGIGLFHDMAETATRFVHSINRTDPRPEYHARYQPYVAAYRQAFEQLRGLYATLATLRDQADATTVSS